MLKGLETTLSLGKSASKELMKSASGLLKSASGGSSGPDRKVDLVAKDIKGLMSYLVRPEVGPERVLSQFEVAAKSPDFEENEQAEDIEGLLRYIQRPRTTWETAFCHLRSSIIDPRFDGAQKVAVEISKLFFWGKLKVKGMKEGSLLELAELLAAAKTSSWVKQEGIKFINKINAESENIKIRSKAINSLLKNPDSIEMGLSAAKAFVEDSNIADEARFQMAYILVSLRDSAAAKELGIALLAQLAGDDKLNKEVRLWAMELLVNFEEASDWATVQSLQLLKSFCEIKDLSSFFLLEAAYLLVGINNNKDANASGYELLRTLDKKNEEFFQYYDQDQAHCLLKELFPGEEVKCFTDNKL
tara:strand:+ start:15321 stop:16400 length:1080 start_codon:yes stop_codon:yes gene_type:complete